MATETEEGKKNGQGHTLRDRTSVEVERDPETYREYYDLVTDQLFKTPAKEGVAFLKQYIEWHGSFWGIGSALLKHSYLGKEDIAKSHPNEPDRIEEALVQLRDKKRKEGSLTLDDVVATSYLLPDEFDRQATFLLAYEFGYLEPQALGVSVTPAPPREMREFFAAAEFLAGSPIFPATQVRSIARNPTKTEGQAYIAEVLQWMDRAKSKGVSLQDLLPKIHFLLHDGSRLYTAAVEDIKQKRYDVAETKLTGLRSAADQRLANIEGPIVYQLAQIALKRKDIKKAEDRLREAVMLPGSAFPSRYGVKQEAAYKDLIAVYIQQKKTPEALWALGHLERYYPQSALLGTHKKFIEEHAFVEGNTAFAAGNLETAVNCFRLETRVKPKNSWGWYYLGMIEVQRRKDASRVESHFDSALAEELEFHNSNDGRTFLNVIQYYRSTKQYNKALLHLERGITTIDKQQVHGTFKPATIKKSTLYFLLAQSYQELAKQNPAYYTKCAQAATRAKQCAPHNTEISTFIEETRERFEKEGKLHFAKDAYAAALPYLEATHTLGAPSDWNTWRIGRCHEAAGDYAAARLAYESLPHFKNAQVGLRRLTRRTSSK